MVTVKNIYRCVVSRCRYDLAVANAINSVLLAKDLTCSQFLESNQGIVKNCNLGCCLNFSLYFMVKLKEAGIHSMLISTPEDGGIKASVAYESSGNWYVADIVEDIKALTIKENEYCAKNDIPATYRKEFRREFNKNFSLYHSIPLDEFKATHAYVKMYADIFMFDMKMSEFLQTSKDI